MKLDKLILICVAIGCALYAFICAVMLGFASFYTPILLVALPVVALFVYILWRVLEDRLTNSEDDYYDKIDK